MNEITGEELGKNGSPRMLATQRCINGVDVTTNQTFYYCVINSTEYEVSREYFVYEVANNNTDCTSNKTVVEKCYCPYDYFGEQCQSYVDLNCTKKQLNYLNNCTGQNAYSYWFDYGGAAPCHYIDLGKSYEIQ